MDTYRCMKLFFRSVCLERYFFGTMNSFAWVELSRKTLDEILNQKSYINHQTGVCQTSQHGCNTSTKSNEAPPRLLELVLGQSYLLPPTHSFAFVQ